MRGWLNSVSDGLDILFNVLYIGFWIFLVGTLIMRRTGYNPFLKDTTDDPVLAASQLVGEGGLQSLAAGTLAGYQYNLMTNSSGRVMVLVQLGHNTNLHLVAVGSKSKADGIIDRRLKGEKLVSVVLEGDFPSHFKVYIAPGTHIESLQIMEPANMARLADFCQAYSFEIYKDTLYVSQAENANQQGDSTTLVKDLEQFLQKNHRVIQILKTK